MISVSLVVGRARGVEESGGGRSRQGFYRGRRGCGGTLVDALILFLNNYLH